MNISVIESLLVLYDGDMADLVHELCRQRNVFAKKVLHQACAKLGLECASNVSNVSKDQLCAALQKSTGERRFFKRIRGAISGLTRGIGVSDRAKYDRQIKALRHLMRLELMQYFALVEEPSVDMMDDVFSLAKNRKNGLASVVQEVLLLVAMVEVAGDKLLAIAQRKKWSMDVDVLPDGMHGHIIAVLTLLKTVHERSWKCLRLMRLDPDVTSALQRASDKQRKSRRTRIAVAAGLGGIIGGTLMLIGNARVKDVSKEMTKAFGDVDKSLEGIGNASGITNILPQPTQPSALSGGARKSQVNGSAKRTIYYTGIGAEKQQMFTPTEFVRLMKKVIKPESPAMKKEFERYTLTDWINYSGAIM